jgi:2-aminoadipate transaminase
LKIGFGYCTHAEWRDKILCIKGHQDFGSAHFTQAIIERVLDKGLYAGHLAGIQEHYKRKAQILESGLVEGDLRNAGWDWSTPRGGLILWLRAPEGSDLRMTSEFCRNCIQQGVLYVPGDLCFSKGQIWNCARLASGALPEAKLREAVKRFAAEAAKL